MMGDASESKSGRFFGVVNVFPLGDASARGGARE